MTTNPFVMTLTDKIAVVTGAGRGIGKAIALALAERGANVVVAARTQSEIDSVAGEIKKLGRKALAVKADVSEKPDVQRLFARAADEFGTVHILVNNAGIGSFAQVADLQLEDFDRMWQVNMRGVFLCTQNALPFMVKQKSGDIVNIASLAGRNAFVGGAGYGATKWALIGFSRSLMLEVRKHNIRVITLCPGSVDTSFGHHTTGAPTSSGEIPGAQDIARVAVDTLSMPRHVMVSEVDIRPTNPTG
jgi:3-oxoacyl-[acyl-carrier protein] reductase